MVSQQWLVLYLYMYLVSTYMYLVRSKRVLVSQRWLTPRIFVR